MLLWSDTFSMPGCVYSGNESAQGQLRRLVEKNQRSDSNNSVEWTYKNPVMMIVELQVCVVRHGASNMEETVRTHDDWDI